MRILRAGATFSTLFMLNCNSSTFVSPLLTCSDSGACLAYQQCLELHPRDFTFCDDASSDVSDDYSPN